MRKEVVGVTVCEFGGWHALCPRWMWRFWGPAGTERSFEQHDYVRRTLCDVYASWWRGAFCFSVALRWGFEDLGLSRVFEYWGIVADDGRKRNTCVKYFPT